MRVFAYISLKLHDLTALKRASYRSSSGLQDGPCNQYVDSPFGHKLGAVTALER